MRTKRGNFEEKFKKYYGNLREIKNFNLICNSDSDTFLPKF